MMLATLTHFLPLTLIRRARLLPVNGRVLVRTGQKVNAIDVIAETNLEGQHVLVNVRRALGFQRSDEADRAVSFKIGDKVQKGDVLAEIRGLIPRLVRSPADGQVVSIAGGQVMIETASRPVAVKAGFNGTVSEINGDRGAVITTSGLLAQGVWGNRQVNTGFLVVVARSANDPLTRDRLDASMRGTVLLGGYCADEEALRFGNELPLRGLILGSMSTELIPTANLLTFPVILLDGFGKVAMNSSAWKILSTSEKREICLNACTWNTFTGERPEVVIPLPSEAAEPPGMAEHKPGATVRVCMPPNMGQIGVVVRISRTSQQLPNRVRTLVAEVELQNEEKTIITVPLANLDVLE
jgi:hypothetical protein